MSGLWLDVVGIGADGLDGLVPARRRLIGEAGLVVGGERHLALVAGLVRGEALAWSSPLAATLQRLEAWRGRGRAVVLASGDPLWFGIGRLLLAHFPADELAFHPHLSAFQLAAARLAWPLGDVACISLHGRALDRLGRHLADGRRLLILTNDGDAPAQIGERLVDAGYGGSAVVVLEALSGPGETITRFAARQLPGRRFGDLNTLAVTLAAEAAVQRGGSLAPGLADDAFLHDGQLTKQAVRAVTLAGLAPRPGEHLWDIGAGAGSVAIEWLLAGRASPDLPTTAVAVEASAERVTVISANAHNLGVPELRVIEGRAPAVLPEGPPPDAIFVGGGLAAPALLETCLERLRPGGRLVANAVTLAAEARLIELQRRHGGALTRIAVSRAEPLGGAGPLGWRPMAPVTQWTLARDRGAGR